MQNIVVPESVITEAAQQCADDPQNGFSKVLKAGQEYKDAGLTPMYLLDPEYMDIFVVAKETFNKKLN